MGKVMLPLTNSLLIREPVKFNPNPSIDLNVKYLEKLGIKASKRIHKGWEEYINLKKKLKDLIVK